MSSDDDSNAPPSKTRRFFEMAKTTASMAGDYTGTRIKSWFQSEEEREASREAAQRRNGERLAETLGELKGAVMKVGQMASVATDLLPDELAEPLEELQRDAPPMPYEVVADQIESELGAPPGVLFDDFDVEPFASASIGQVHRAVTDDGREAVVKVQYPGIDDSVSSDLGQLKMALRASGFLNSDKRAAFDELFDEIEARLREELDYTHEADNVRLFHSMYEDDPDVVVPEVIGERSAKRVLTLTYEPGDELRTVREDYSWAQKDALGQKLFAMFGTQLFVDKTIHADPNPANYAFRPDGTVVLYDYGCVKQLADDQHRSLLAIMRAGLNRDWEALDQALLDLGARIPDKPPIPDEVYETWHSIFISPILEQDPYDYGDGVIYERFRENFQTFLDYEAWFQPPPGGVYIDRTVAGLHNILRKLEARVPCERIVRESLEAGESVA
ncbi:MAG: ABC1 kinase family protein [Bradymonadaceae bacterium]